MSIKNNFNSLNFQVIYLILTCTHSEGGQKKTKNKKHPSLLHGEYKVVRIKDLPKATLEKSGMSSCQPRSQNTLLPF